MQKKNESKIAYVLWAIGVLTICLYRMFIMKDYTRLYVDDDQALMWYGTVSAAHFDLSEPHFLGQGYGSMIESVVAVPFYWLGIGLNICLPLATFILWISPFAILSFVCLRRKRSIWAIIILLNSLLARWDYDILTNIPRSFIGGFVFAFIGVLLLENKDKISKIVAVVLMAIAYISTQSTITIIGIGILYYLLWNLKSIKKDGICFAIGGVFSLLLIWYCNYGYYSSCPEYNFYGSIPFSVSIDALKENVGRIGTVLSSMSLISISNVPILLILLVLIFLVSLICFKKWRDVILVLCAVVGSLSFFALSKTLHYEETLLFSQSRMFLFIPYVELIVLYYTSHIEESIIKELSHRKYRVIVCTLTMLIILVGISKTVYFESIVLDNELLYYDPVVGVTRVDSIYDMAEAISEAASESGVDTVVFLTDDKALGYASSAINYEQYLGYNASYDRRSATYVYLKNTLYDKSILLVETDDRAITNMYARKLENITPTEWLIDEYGYQRCPGYEY